MSFEWPAGVIFPAARRGNGEDIVIVANWSMRMNMPAPLLPSWNIYGASHPEYPFSKGGYYPASVAN
ncbi:hypothetical protein [Rugamonas sp. DEMB1]|uniref:hypothetical protein n=1 Tax=Rugamonas sp. DEMB1 TaxID=3039386 RepID=UPI002446B6E7|nr:hypothetical protein [Rugamonas sp. DEMB1]WGG51954.1 hypothetical protein QC826_07085 [Rugamonas sp. DEMB1]